jgi:hypothetical protein
MANEKQRRACAVGSCYGFFSGGVLIMIIPRKTAPPTPVSKLLTLNS